MASNQDLELTVDVYLELTADVPFRWLQVAVHRLMLDPETRFAPRVGELRQRAALEVLRTWRRQHGENPDRQTSGAPITIRPHNIDHWIARARTLEGLPEIPGPSSMVAELPAGFEERIKQIEEATSVRSRRD